jgi:Mg-chelatase subunit ChlD
MEGLLRSSEEYISHIARACRLQDVRAELERLLKALCGRPVEVSDLGALDSDELIERGSRSVCFYRWLYLPASCSLSPGAAGNREWYKLAAVCAAGMLAAGCFPAVHGHRGCRSPADLVGEGLPELNLFSVLEYARGIAYVRRHWPGAAGLLSRVMNAEFGAEPPRSPADTVLREVLGAASVALGPAGELRAAAASCAGTFAAAELVRGQRGRRLLAACPGLGSAPLRPVAFLPDLGYPGEVSAPPPDSVVEDLRRRSRGGADPDRQLPRPDAEPREARAAAGGGELSDQRGRETAGTGAPAGYVYDEWSHADRDYYRDYCVVREVSPDAGAPGRMPEGFGAVAARVRRSFELLRPDAPHREKYLPEGEVINGPQLVDYMVRRRREGSPRVDFYERPRLSRRDVAVLLLLDVSGSTGAAVRGAARIIDAERAAAVILAESLSAIGDRFAVCGFSGHGRQNCRFMVYKDFADGWDRASRRRVLAARPATGTRIGAALRHAGYRLGRVGARRRIILLVTDGKPLDADYDPGTRHAHFDVRRACRENRGAGIHTLCICTDETSRADADIMFPERRFAILRRAEELPRRMAELYLRVTR